MFLEAGKNKFAEQLYFWGLMFFGFSLRIFNLRRSLGDNDENQILLEFAGSPISYIVSNYSHGSGGHHVFHTLILHGMTVLFGEDNSLAIRAPAFFSGLILLWLSYLIALQLFQSKIVARYALLAAVVCPVHVFYSQIARGYSFSMTFGLLCVFSVIRYLESSHIWYLGSILLISGFLMVYTIPTNVFFIFSIVVWLSIVLGIPNLRKEFVNLPKSFSKPILTISMIFVAMGLLVLIAYFPLIKGILDSAENFFLVKTPYPTREDIAFKLIPDLFRTLYPGQLLWFFPFIIAAIASSKISKISYRLLPVLVIMVPFFLAFTFKLAWYPRAYIYSGPILNIYLGAGLYWFFLFFHNTLGYRLKYFAAFFILLFCFVSIRAYYQKYFPRLQTLNLAKAAKLINIHSGKNDLLLIANKKNYLHARSIYKNRLKNIISEGKLGGINFLKNEDSSLANYIINRKTKGLFIFNGLFEKQIPKNIIVGKGLGLLPIIKGNWASHLPDDYESTVKWNMVSEKGRVEPWPSNALEGNNSLLLQADEDSPLIAYAVFPKLINIQKTSVVVLTWVGRNLGLSSSINHPEIATMNVSTGNLLQLPLGEINDGVKVYWKESNMFFSHYWLLITNMARVSPGKYTMSLWLKALPGEKILYDGFRFFILELNPD